MKVLIIHSDAVIGETRVRLSVTNELGPAWLISPRESHCVKKQPNWPISTTVHNENGQRV